MFMQRTTRKNVLARWADTVTLLIGAIQLRWTQPR